MTKIKPILFSTPIVQAILAGSKTQTRRIIKNVDDHYFQSLVLHATGKYTFVPNGNYAPTASDVVEVKPKYQKGDILWVRETFAEYDLKKVSAEEGKYFYKANNFDADIVELFKQEKLLSKWKPSIHMPKEAARIFLEVTNVRLERLQDITKEDAINEGILPLEMSLEQKKCQGQLYYNYSRPTQFVPEGLCPFWSFSTLWCSINGSDSWEANPFVWVYEFKQVEKPDNFIQ